MKTEFNKDDIALLRKVQLSKACNTECKQALELALANIHENHLMSADRLNHLTDVCRNVALIIEWVDIPLAHQLMKLALALRPSGTLLLNKCNEYKWLIELAQKGLTDSNGLMFNFNENTPAFLLKILANGTYEQAETALIKQFITSEDRVLELGAGIGYMGVLAMTHCKPASYIAYEANPALIPLIKQNMESNKVQFDVRNAILLNHEKDQIFYVTPVFLGSSLIQPRSGTYETVMIPSHNKHVVIEELKPTALIVDIEGGEDEFFNELDLNSVNKIIMEIHPAVLDDVALSKLYGQLISAGFLLHFNASSKVVLYWYR
jgi:FkbM family methyltransferase